MEHERNPTSFGKRDESFISVQVYTETDIQIKHVYIYLSIDMMIWILYLIQEVDFMFQICKVKILFVIASKLFERLSLKHRSIPVDPNGCNLLRLGSYGLAVLCGFPRRSEGEVGIYH